MTTDAQLDFLELSLRRAQMDLESLRRDAMQGDDAWISQAFINIAEDKVQKIKDLIAPLKLKSKGLESF